MDLSHSKEFLAMGSLGSRGFVEIRPAGKGASVERRECSLHSCPEVTVRQAARSKLAPNSARTAARGRLNWHLTLLTRRRIAEW